MKAPFLNRKSKGFTLIELLVVIAIILTLAGISMIVVNGVMEKSRVTTARSDCNGLQTAIENYMMDNGRPPVAWTGREMSRKARKDGQYYLTTALDDDSRIMSILTNHMDRGDEDRKLNPKKTAYFNTTTTDVEGAPGLFFESRGTREPDRPMGISLPHCSECQSGRPFPPRPGGFPHGYQERGRLQRGQGQAGQHGRRTYQQSGIYG